MSHINNTEFMDESTLIDDCIKGSSLAQKKLFDKFAPKMLFVCLRYCKDKESAEDVLQDSFIKIFTHLSEYNKDKVLEAWIRRIVVNTALDFLRKNKKESFQVSIDDAFNVFSREENPIEKMNANHLLEIIHAMPKGYRIVFNLFAIEGYSHKEIAELLSISEETSKSQFFRARTFLRKKFDLQSEYIKLENV